MRVVVTGGAGFIGMNLVRLLVSRGHDVVVVDNLSTGYADNIAALDVELVEASILDLGALDHAMAGASSVVHLAALGSVPRSVADPLNSHQHNATGTLAVLEASRRHGVDHVVSASSSSVYGLNPVSPKGEREWVRPMSPYAVSKLATEQYTLAYQQSFGLKTLAFRFFNVYGPGQRAGHAYAAVIPIFVDALLRGLPLPINGDGTQSRDFTYVGTLCSVLLRAVEETVTHPEPVNLAFGSNTNLLDLAAKLGEVMGVEPRVEFRPPRTGDVPHSRAENASLMSLFLDVQAVSLDKGIQHTVAWAKEKA